MASEVSWAFLLAADAAASLALVACSAAKRPNRPGAAASANAASLALSAANREARPGICAA